MPLREGWKEAFQALSLKGVPTYIFSSGYGDVVAQSLLLNGIAEEATAALPQNLRIISNFFRTAPDGTVRAFSQPGIFLKHCIAAITTHVHIINILTDPPLP